MIEKKKWMEENYDKVRTALMFEPKKEMFHVKKMAKPFIDKINK